MDKFNEWTVSAFVTPGSKRDLWWQHDNGQLIVRQDMKFVLLHEGKNDEGIRLFFNEVWEVYVKVSDAEWILSTPADHEQTMLNPFHTAHSGIVSGVFDARVRASARKHL